MQWTRHKMLLQSLLIWGHRKQDWWCLWRLHAQHRGHQLWSMSGGLLWGPCARYQGPRDLQTYVIKSDIFNHSLTLSCLSSLWLWAWRHSRWWALWWQDRWGVGHCSRAVQLQDIRGWEQVWQVSEWILELHIRKPRRLSRWVNSDAKCHAFMWLNSFAPPFNWLTMSLCSKSAYATYEALGTTTVTSSLVNAHAGHMRLAAAATSARWDSGTFQTASPASAMAMLPHATTRYEELKSC